ncbi:sulfite exporter TauE/SafE family protein [Gilvimarinus sp. HB14]|uniref:Sulfite exporter TauE/SafE family protein n=1 Tax=Gilvimarinus xylanilyticus TaxID=2944139 RepID=A0A9X2KVB4_9GAMM|nr:sulfite exporter TauE/SafE family protein [Gilvimarinus xylanilyticus]
MTDTVTLATGLLLGFFSSAHCVGMCGGIMGALSLAMGQVSKSRQALILVSYNLGRIASYTLMGALVASVGEQLVEVGAWTFLRLLAALLLLAMALYLVGWWRGLTRLETLGGKLWRHVQPLGKKLMPVRTPGAALLLGGLWGWLPCGLVYTALGYAMIQSSIGQGAIFMTAFGLGTLPAVLLVALATTPAKAVLRSRFLRYGAALLLVIFAIWTAYGALGGHHGGHSHGSMPAQTTDSPSHQHHHHH